MLSVASALEDSSPLSWRAGRPIGSRAMSTPLSSLTSVTPGTPSPPERPRLRPDDGRLARGRRSRARIRAAARSLFEERGFDGATLRAIGERAGMGASSIYRHVQSKEELLIEELFELQEEARSR